MTYDGVSNYKDTFEMIANREQQIKSDERKRIIEIIKAYGLADMTVELVALIEGDNNDK